MAGEKYQKKDVEGNGKNEDIVIPQNEVERALVCKSEDRSPDGPCSMTVQTQTDIVIRD